MVPVTGFSRRSVSFAGWDREMENDASGGACQNTLSDQQPYKADLTARTMADTVEQRHRDDPGRGGSGGTG